MEERIIQVGAFYRHFKNKCYQVLAVAIHSETRENLVIYQALYGDYKVYARPYDMFVGEVDHLKYPEVTQKYRFEKIRFEDGNVISMEEESIHEEVKTKAISESGQNEVTSLQQEEEVFVNPLLLSFLELNTYEEKLEAWIAMRDKLDEKLIYDIAAVLDIALEEGSIKQKYESIKTCLMTFVRFEDNRLR